MTTQRGGRRRLATVRLFALLAAAACASAGMPPGGPEDSAAPVLVATSPESGAVNVRASAVVLRFDEVINERSTASGGGGSAGFGASGGFGPTVGSSSTGASSLATVVVISPSNGRERINWRRTAIEIDPRGDFRPNTSYRVSVLPGLGDLRGNVLKDPLTFVFATGESVHTGAVTGVVFDWVAARPGVLARVALFGDADTTFRWTANADSLGRFVVRDLPPGRYHLRGWLDANSDRALGAREAFDSISFDLTERLEMELYAFEHDTIGPRIELVELVDSTALRIRFDRAAALGFTPDSASLILLASDSSHRPLGTAVPAARFDSLRRAATAARDSAAAARDTTPPVARDTVPPAASRDLAARDSTAPRPPPLNRPIPNVSWVASITEPLPPGEYRVQARGFVGLTGASRVSERVFRVRPPAPPPKDSVATPPRAARPP